MKRLICLLVAALALGGCGGVYTGDYDKYADALGTHSTAEATRISGQSTSIASVASSIITKTETEKALVGVIAMIQISQLAPVPLNIVKPTTGMDVLDTVAGNIPLVTVTAGMYKLGEAGISAAGNVAINSAGDMSMSESLNDTDLHVTGANTETPISYRPTTINEASDTSSASDAAYDAALYEETY